MPTLQITKCEDCPHHRIEREHWMDDCYRIFCEHEEQTNIEGYTTKINRGGGIHFNCPLDKPEIIKCTNEKCDWEGTKEETNFYDWDNVEYNHCPKCNTWL